MVRKSMRRRRHSLNAGRRNFTCAPRGKAMRRDASKSLKNERERVERLASRCLVLSNSRECPAMVSILSSIIISTIPLFALVTTMEGERRLLRNIVDVAASRYTRILFRSNDYRVVVETPNDF